MHIFATIPLPKTNSENTFDTEKYLKQAASRYVALSSESENDELFTKKAEDFEYKFNFRHEEPNADKLTSFPRTVPTSVRQTLKDEKSKTDKENQKLKKQAAKKQKLDDKKLKQAIKKQELAEKLALITKADEFDDDNMEKLGIDLDQDFDEKKHEELMQKLFDAEFYEKEDSGSNVEKPYWDDLEAEMQEEEEQIVEQSRKTRRKLERQKKRKAKSKNKVEADIDLEQLQENNPELKDDIDEINKLEVEASGEHFFKYRKTTPNDFGLTLNFEKISNFSI